jgi:hypothetical protein
MAAAQVSHETADWDHFFARQNTVGIVVDLAMMRRAGCADILDCAALTI